jgi:hypothetical protein
MPDVVLYLRGDQIAWFNAASATGNGDDIAVVLTGVQTLGTPVQVFRVVVRQVTAGQTEFLNGQFVDIYAYPDTADPPVPVISSLVPQHDAYDGRASSAEHQIFADFNVVFDVNGLQDGTAQYGPGPTPPRAELLPFAAFAESPPIAMCFAADTCLRGVAGPVQAGRLRAGALLWTLDAGLQPVVWVGGRQGTDAAVEIPSGLFAASAPVVVTAQHRILLRAPALELAFGAPEVFVPAQALVRAGVARACLPALRRFVHVLMPRHSVLDADGVLAESLYPAPTVVSGYSGSGRTGLVAAVDALPPGPIARPDLRGAQAVLAARMACAAKGAYSLRQRSSQTS